MEPEKSTSIAALSRATFPVLWTSLVGRTENVATLAEALRSHRLVTLAGAGGVGKTRLAIAVAQHVAARYPSGAWFVDLASVTEASQIVGTIANTLLLFSDADPRITLLDYLATRDLLLILDNCEQLIDAVASLTLVMLQRAPRLTVLTTSREILRVAGEWVWRVPALATPSREATDPLSYAAVRLFVERSAARAPQLPYSPRDLQEIASICTRLDGIPLAIELAAARTTVLSLAQIAQRLADVFNLLISHDRGTLPRHQTLRATIAWSYQLLTPAEQLLLCRMAVCTGSWTLAVAEALGGVPPLDFTAILEVLTSLIDKSLIGVEEDTQGKRYRLLETIRQFVLEQLACGDELTECHQRHMEYYIQFGQRAAIQVIGPDQAVWLTRIDAEIPNIWSAYTWGRARGDCDAMLTIATNLGEYWNRRGKYAEGRAWLEDALHYDGIVDHLLYATALYVHGNLARFQRDPVAWGSLQQARELCAARGDTLGQGRALSALGWFALHTGDVVMADVLLEEAMALLEDGPHGMVYFEALGRYGWVFVEHHDYQRARTIFAAAVDGCRDLSELFNLAGRLLVLGEFLRLIGDNDGAEECYHESAKLNMELGNRPGYADCVRTLALVALQRGDSMTAYERQCEALTIFMQHQGNASNMYCSLILAGAIRVVAGDLLTSAHIFGSAEAYAEKHGVSMFTPESQDLFSQEYTKYLTQLQAQMEGRAFEAAWSAGHREPFAVVLERCFISPPAIISAAISETITRESGKVEEIPHLTNREREVLRLLAHGLTNRQIADQLVVSLKTVSAHLATIFKKLQVTTRSAATRYALEHHLG